MSRLLAILSWACLTLALHAAPASAQNQCPLNPPMPPDPLPTGFDWRPLAENWCGQLSACGLTGPGCVQAYLDGVEAALAGLLAGSDIPSPTPQTETIVLTCRDSLEFAADPTICNPACVAVGDVRVPEFSGHLEPRTVNFSYSEPNEPSHWAGTLDVSPILSCRDGQVAVSLFGGVSREPEFFTLKTTAGSPPRFYYLEQWANAVIATFNNGATADMPLQSGLAFPTGATYVTKIEMNFDNGREGGQNLTWALPAPPNP